jgi:trans-aconitate 2-methyltransferase
MTEWDAPEYARLSGLQQAMAEEVLALLDLKGKERVNVAPPSRQLS